MNLLELPPEIREEIYRPILDPNNYRETDARDYTTYNYRPALASLFRINRQIYYESRRIFLEKNTFIVIETPWSQAQEHVKLNGKVPILCEGAYANEFKDHTMTVSISAPREDMDFTPDDLDRFVIHVDDLYKFTTSWRYSDLDHGAALNPYLSLTLTLRDPKRRSDFDTPSIPKATQSLLLTPWSDVKNLHSMTITGDPEPYQSLIKSVRLAQETPYPTPEECLSECARLKDLGNDLLKSSLYDEALATYTSAWAAIHILVKGTSRVAHADAMYNHLLTSGPYKGQSAQLYRLVLRVRLVANTVLTYLKKTDYVMAKYWGMRTIGMMRSSIGLGEGESAARAEDEAILGFVSANEMGKIYYRTALAWKELGDKSEARPLLRVAKVYLPNDLSVVREIGECALRLG